MRDVGCGNGDFVDVASQLGWNAEGIDIDEAALAIARNRGLKSQRIGVGSLRSITQRYDAITRDQGSVETRC